MKTYTLQRGTLYLEDADGNVTGFNGVEEYFKYTGKTLPSIFSVSYEPDRDLHAIFNGVTTVTMPLPNASYDEDIANVLLYQSRIDDPYYGLSEEEKREQVEARALSLLEGCYRKHLASTPISAATSAAINRKGGTPKAKDTKILADLDIIDDWQDQLEVDKEVGEAWVEDPLRTTEELIAFDPCADVTWTEPPVLS